jgi:uncharacterized membrane protein
MVPGMESRRRSVAKAISYRVFATFTTGLIAWAFTGKLGTALQIGVADGVMKLFGYFLHERVWTRVKYGLPKPPEYEI